MMVSRISMSNMTRQVLRSIILNVAQNLPENLYFGIIKRFIDAFLTF